MLDRNIKLDAPERFQNEYNIPKSKLISAAEKALERIEKNISKSGDFLFPQNMTKNYMYPMGENNNWICGMWTGLFWLAYELSGDKKFKDEAERQIKGYRKRLDTKLEMQDHDVGFVFSPSCIMGYKITGDEEMKNISLEAAEYNYSYNYTEKGGFVQRMADYPYSGGCRTMMDTLMNIPIFFWAHQMTGDKKYYDAAVSQYEVTEKYLIRKDASSYHHFEFEPETFKPLKGITLQGYSDESCWSRGHSWGVYGFPIAYSYTKDEQLINLHKDVTYFMLNHLPDDLIPYWDYTFTSGDECRDSSAGAIAICGMNEMCRHLPENAPQKKIFENASLMMLDSLIDNCTTPPHKDAEGILFKTTGSVPHKMVLEECAMYGDYFYLEALVRYLKPDWKMRW